MNALGNCPIVAPTEAVGKTIYRSLRILVPENKYELGHEIYVLCGPRMQVTSEKKNNNLVNSLQIFFYLGVDVVAETAKRKLLMQKVVSLNKR